MVEWRREIRPLRKPLGEGTRAQAVHAAAKMAVMERQRSSERRDNGTARELGLDDGMKSRWAGWLATRVCGWSWSSGVSAWRAGCETSGRAATKRQGAKLQSSILPLLLGAAATCTLISRTSKARHNVFSIGRQPWQLTDICSDPNLRNHVATGSNALPKHNRQQALPGNW